MKKIQYLVSFLLIVSLITMMGTNTFAQSEKSNADKAKGKEKKEIKEGDQKVKQGGYKLIKRTQAGFTPTNQEIKKVMLK